MKTKYGLKALGILAQEYGKGPLLASRISKQERIPPDFLRIILLQLKNGGLLQSKKGEGGGYYLMRKPSTISVGLLVRISEGHFIFYPVRVLQVKAAATVRTMQPVVSPPCFWKHPMRLDTFSIKPLSPN